MWTSSTESPVDAAEPRAPPDGNIHPMVLPTTDRPADAWSRRVNGRWRDSQPASAVQQQGSLLIWLRAARAIVVIAGACAALLALALLARGRRLEAITMGIFGIGAAVTARVVIGYVAWRIQAATEASQRNDDPAERT